MLIHLEKLGKTFGEKVVLHDVTASVEREDRIGIVGQNGAGKTTLLKILTGEYQDYEGEFSVTHGVTLGYLEQNAKLDATLDLYGEMRSTFAPVLDAMAQMQVLERKKRSTPVFLSSDTGLIWGAAFEKAEDTLYRCHVIGPVFYSTASVDGCYRGFTAKDFGAYSSAWLRDRFPGRSAGSSPPEDTSCSGCGALVCGPA